MALGSDPVIQPGDRVRPGNGVNRTMHELMDLLGQGGAGAWVAVLLAVLTLPVVGYLEWITRAGARVPSPVWFVGPVLVACAGLVAARSRLGDALDAREQLSPDDLASAAHAAVARGLVPGWETLLLSSVLLVVVAWLAAFGHLKGDPKDRLVTLQPLVAFAPIGLGGAAMLAWHLLGGGSRLTLLPALAAVVGGPAIALLSSRASGDPESRLGRRLTAAYGLVGSSVVLSVVFAGLGGGLFSRMLLHRANANAPVDHLAALATDAASLDLRNAIMTVIAAALCFIAAVVPLGLHAGAVARPRSLVSGGASALLVSMVFAALISAQGRANQLLIDTPEVQLASVRGHVRALPTPDRGVVHTAMVRARPYDVLAAVDGGQWRWVDEWRLDQLAGLPLGPTTVPQLLTEATDKADLLTRDAWFEPTIEGELWVVLSFDDTAVIGRGVPYTFRVGALPFAVMPPWDEGNPPAAWSAWGPNQIAVVQPGDGATAEIRWPSGRSRSLGPVIEAPAALSGELLSSGTRRVVFAPDASWTVQQLVSLCQATRTAVWNVSTEPPGPAVDCALAPSASADLAALVPKASDATKVSRGRRARTGGFKGGNRSSSGSTSIRGSLPADDVARVLASAQGRVSACGRGSLTVRLRVAADGGVLQASSGGATGGGASAEGCVLGIVRGLRFPASQDGGQASISHTYRLGG